MIRKSRGSFCYWVTIPPANSYKIRIKILPFHFLGIYRTSSGSSRSRLYCLDGAIFPVPPVVYQSGSWDIPVHRRRGMGHETAPGHWVPGTPGSSGKPHSLFLSSTLTSLVNFDLRNFGYPISCPIFHRIGSGTVDHPAAAHCMPSW